MIDPKVAVPDEVVVEALLRDAKRFRSKWELNVNEPTRSRPNTRFLKRTLNNLVKTNQDRMRRPRLADSVEREIRAPLSADQKRHRTNSKNRNSCEPSTSHKFHNRQPEEEKCRKKTKNCSKSKHRSPSRKSDTKHKRKKKSKNKEKKSSN